MKLEKKYCLYFHLKKGTNIVFYVGIGDKYRPFVDLDRSKLWHRTANKYGYYVIIKHTNIDWYNACKLEIAWIKKIGRRDKGLGTLVNHTDGGDGIPGYRHTDYFKVKKSREMIEFYKDEKNRKNLSEKTSGENNGMWGKTHKKEVVDNLIASNKKNLWNLGRKFTKKHVLNMSKSQKGKKKKHPPTEEHRKNMRLAQKKRRQNEKKHF